MFLIIGALPILAVFEFLTLSPETGAHVTGHRRREAVEAPVAAATASGETVRT